MQTIFFYSLLTSLSVPAALSVLGSFGSISGYKLNLGKSELLPLNKAAREYPLHTLSFKVAQHELKYLGIQVTAKFRDLYRANFIALLSQVQSSFKSLVSAELISSSSD